MRITLADYGVGNLHSIRKALERFGASVACVTDMGELLNAECVVFPGVGAFDKAMERLQPFREGVGVLLESGVPALGICVGAQIMLDSSEEGAAPGVGFISGRVIKLDAGMTPHMGWNTVESGDALLDGIDDRHFYFAHSYRCSPSDASAVAGTTEYEGRTFPSLLRKANFYGTQFHPEKSGESGLELISNYIDFAEEHI